MEKRICSLFLPKNNLWFAPKLSLFRTENLILNAEPAKLHSKEIRKGSEEEGKDTCFHPWHNSDLFPRDL